MFKNDLTNIMDAKWSWKLSTSATDEKQEQGRPIILTQVSVTIEEIASQLGITKGTACSLVHDILVFHKISASWMPKHLTEGRKHNFQHICCSLLERCNHKGDNFVNCIITRDETWLYHQEPETKWRNVQWTYSFFSSKKSKSRPSASKLVGSVLGLPKAYP